jgi:hypothetical protein
MANVIDTILWRRIDTPGHDACRLESGNDGWQLEGTAVFLHEGVPAHLAYHVLCDLGWRTRQGQVHGWFGANSVDFSVTRAVDGDWTMSGAVVPGLGDCLDLDFSFTPATNLLQLRRLSMVQGQAVSHPVAWLDVFAGTLEILNQSYERRSEAAYWYEAAKFDYAAVLEVTPTGFIHSYPGLWEAES